MYPKGIKISADKRTGEVYMSDFGYDQRTVASLMRDIDKQLAYPDPDVVKVMALQSRVIAFLIAKLATQQIQLDLLCEHGEESWR